MYQERDQSGTLFKNVKKEKPNHPDYTGKAIINGTPVYVSAWIKDGANGKFLSLGFKNREQGGFDKKQSAAQSQAPLDDDPDSVPF